MPKIHPISVLRDYYKVLKDVDEDRRVYLTKNGYGAYVIMTLREANDLDKTREKYEEIIGIKTEQGAEKDGSDIILLSEEDKR